MLGAAGRRPSPSPSSFSLAALGGVQQPRPCRPPAEPTSACGPDSLSSRPSARCPPAVTIALYSNTTIVDSAQRAGLIFETLKWLVPR